MVTVCVCLLAFLAAAALAVINYLGQIVGALDRIDNNLNDIRVAAERDPSQDDFI